MKGELFPDRNIIHKQMGPLDSCDQCYGTGRVWAVTPGTESDYIPDAYEVYCECPCGEKRQEIETISR